MKKVKQTILYLVAFAVALFLLMVVVNLPVFDEELLPEVKAIKNIKAKPFETDNAYLSMWAFGTKKEQPFKQTVHELRTHINQKIQQFGVDVLSTEEVNEFVARGSEMSWKNKYSRCNSREDVSCMRQYIKQFSDREINDVRLLELLNRYQGLLSHQNYQEAVSIDLSAPMMGYGTILDVKRIYLARAYHNQTPEDFLQTTMQDMKFWRVVLKQGHYLLTQMIAVSTLRDSLGVLNEAIKKDHFTTAQLNGLLNALSNINASEKDMTETFKYELKYGMSMWDSATSEDQKSWTDVFGFFQLNATHNTNYNYVTKPLGELSKLDSMSLYQKVNSSDGTLASPVSWSPGMMYNPAGKLVTSYSLPAYSHYMGRIHDLDGMVSLLKLQIEITLKSTQKIEQVIQSSQYNNPYTGEPFRFNKENNSIYFKCLEPHSTCELML